MSGKTHKLNVFISWSGATSEQVGRAFGEWVTCVFQHVAPFFSQEIDKGARWNDEITAALKQSVLGIICLTRQNVSSPSILFEAGALANGLSHSKIVTVLLDIDPSDISWPLSQFQHTLLKDPTKAKEQMRALAQSINNSSGEHVLEQKVLEKTFSMFWDDLAEGLSRARLSTPADITPSPSLPIHTGALTSINEILEHVRALRYGYDHAMGSRGLRILLADDSEAAVGESVYTVTGKGDHRKVGEVSKIIAERNSFMLRRPGTDDIEIDSSHNLWERLTAIPF